MATATATTTKATVAKIGQRVKTASSYSVRSYRTRIESIRVNELGTIIYVMENGQHLNEREFEVEK